MSRLRFVFSRFIGVADGLAARKSSGRYARISGLRRIKCSDQFVDCSLAGYEPIDPVQIGEADAKTAPRLGVFDPKRNNDLAGLAGDGDFTPDVFAFVAALGENQKHCPAGIDGVGDLVVERLSRPYVSRRDPAGYATALKLADDIQGGYTIFSDVANEQKEIWWCHASNRRSTRASAMKTAPTPLLKPEFMVDKGGVSIEAKKPFAMRLSKVGK